LGNSALDLNANTNLQQQVIQNDFISNTAKARIAQSESEGKSLAVLDNRSFFNGLLDSQMNYRANGNVDQVGKNGRKESTLPESRDRAGVPSDKTSIPPQIAADVLPQLPTDLDGRQNSYQGRRTVPMVQSALNPTSGESKDSGELASRYKSKLQSQSGSKSNAYNNANVPVPPPPTNTASPPGAYGGGMGGSSTMGRQAGNNLGVTPAFGAPDDSKSSIEEMIAQTISPNTWQSVGGTTTMKEFRQNLSLVVTAPQETTRQSAEQPFMNSLAINMPSRGKEFFFSTPRGNSELIANGISKSVTQRIVGLVILVLGIVLFRRLAD